MTLIVDYTWSKTLDESDTLGNGGIYGPPTANPTRFNINIFRGPAGFDIRQRLRASYAFNVPWQTHNQALDFMLGKWQLSGVVTADTGVPYFVYLTTDRENIGIAAFGSPRYTDFPNLGCNPNSNFQPTTSAWFNTSCFQLPAFGTRGDAGRHRLYSQGLLNWDGFAQKEWPVDEKKSFQFRAEFFNAASAHTIRQASFSARPASARSQIQPANLGVESNLL